MNNNSWFKKEMPLQTVIGFGGGATGFGAYSSSSVPPKYVDEVFSTYVYKGNETSRNITNNINLNKGGLVWVKSRNDTHDHHLADTVRGANQIMMSNDTAVDSTLANRITAFNNDGFTLGTAGQVNGTSAYDYSSWTFRKAKGFFDIVSYSGDGVSGRTISHGLGCVPGLIIIKSTTNATSWFTYHRSLGATKYMMLNHDNTEATQSWFMNDTTPTATEFTLGSSTNVNGSGRDYIAYIFAGGESTAATARSVEFDGATESLQLASNADLAPGTGDFTFECWLKPASWTSSVWEIIYHNGAVNGLTIGKDSSENFIVRASNNTSFIEQSSLPPIGHWTHVAVTRSGSTLRLFYNGVLKNSVSNSHDFVTAATGISATAPSSGEAYAGEISNLRFVKGTAVYTSSFIAPTEPLTNITNTKLLCCNNSSVTGSTVTPETITTNGSPTASTDSPFDDPDGFKFGENEDKGLIKMGSYTGTATAGNKVDLGWEPSWIMFKRATGGTANWEMCDVMRGDPANDGTTQNANFLRANTNGAEFTNRPFSPYSTGFDIRNTGGGSNASGVTYVYMAIRRPDGVVGKPPSAGTDVFAMDTGNSSNTIPTMDSGFPVDFAIMRSPGVVDNNNTGTRLTTQEGMQLNTAAAGSNYNSSSNQWMWDSNVGWLANSNYGTSTNSWMWKRGQGFDVVTYQGNSTAGHGVRHSLGAIPEMMWVKNRSSTYGWFVYHKDLNGGTNPQNYYLEVNSSSAEVDDDAIWNDTAPTSAGFTLSNSNEINSSSGYYLALLFASANDEEGNPISKVGSYSGSSSEVTVTTGFQPRFVLIKRATGIGQWTMFDTFRGWTAGNDQKLELSASDAQSNSFDYGEPTATGFTITTGQSATNNNGDTYIYYAHA